MDLSRIGRPAEASLDDYVHTMFCFSYLSRGRQDYGVWTGVFSDTGLDIEAPCCDTERDRKRMYTGKTKSMNEGQIDRPKEIQRLTVTYLLKNLMLISVVLAGKES